MVPHYNECLDMILDIEDDTHSRSDSERSGDSRPSSTVIEQGAEKLYGLIHARYVLTKPGLQVIMERYRNQEFGTCPRTFCQENPVVPTGRYDAPGIDTVKLFCSRCGDLYHPREVRFVTERAKAGTVCRFLTPRPLSNHRQSTEASTAPSSPQPSPDSSSSPSPN